MNKDIKQYVLNLDNAKERWAHISKEFAKLNLPIIRVSALDKNQLTEEKLAHYRQGYYRLLRDTELLCFLSHRKAWQLVAEGDEDYACIYEDDVHLSALLPDFLKKRPWPPHIGLLSLERFYPKTPCAKKTVWEEGGYSIYRTLDFYPGAAGYLLSKEFAKIIIKESEIFHYQLDGFLFNPRREIPQRYKAYQVQPALCVQNFNAKELIKTKEGFFREYETQQSRTQDFTRQALRDKKDLAYYYHRIRRILRFVFNRYPAVFKTIDFYEERPQDKNTY